MVLINMMTRRGADVSPAHPQDVAFLTGDGITIKSNRAYLAARCALLGLQWLMQPWSRWGTGPILMHPPTQLTSLLPLPRAAPLSRCEYFDKLLYGSMREGQMTEIRLPSTSAAALRAVLDYLYTGRRPLPPAPARWQGTAGHTAAEGREGSGSRGKKRGGGRMFSPQPPLRTPQPPGVQGRAPGTHIPLPPLCRPASGQRRERGDAGADVQPVASVPAGERVPCRSP